MCPSAGCVCGEIGFRFKPLDEELILHFLHNKMIGNNHLVRAIAEIDLCKFEPWELPRQSAVKSGDSFWYFFYQLDFKYSNRNRANRSTKLGFWKATGKDRVVTDPYSNQEIARKKTLVFHEGRVPNGVATRWIIHEYRPAPAATPPNPRPYVLCRLERKPVEKNSSPRKAEPGSYSASTSNRAAEADNATEVAPALQERQEPIHSYNSMDHELAIQTSMEEQGISLEDLVIPDDNQFRVQEEARYSHDVWPNGFSVEEQDEFVNSMLVDGDEFFAEETVYTRLHDHTPSKSWTGEVENEMVNVQVKDVFTIKSRYQPRSCSLAEVGSNSDETIQVRKTKAGLHRGSSEVASSGRRGSFVFLEMNQLTCTPRPPSEYICNVFLGVVVLIFVVTDIAFRH